MSNKKFHFEFKKIIPKIQDFFLHVHFFIPSNLAFFNSFFIQIKVKHSKFEKIIKKKLLKFSLLSLMFILFFLPKIFCISLHHFQTHVQKRNYNYQLSLKFIIVICLKNKNIYFQIIIDINYSTLPKKIEEPLLCVCVCVCVLIRYYRATLVRQSLHRYKCLWVVGG